MSLLVAFSLVSAEANVKMTTLETKVAPPRICCDLLSSDADKTLARFQRYS